MIQDLFLLFFFSLDVITWLAWQRLDEAKILWFAATLEWANYIEVLIGSFSNPIDFGNPYVVSRTYVRRTHAQERKILEFCLKRSLFHHSWLIPSFIRFVLGGACVVRPYFGLLGLFRFLNSFLDWFDNYIQYCRRFIHDSFIHDSFIQLIDFFHATTLRRERERY